METQEGPRGVQVLQIDSVKVVQHYEGEDVELAKGILEVLLVTLDVEHPTTRSPKPRQSEKLGEDYSTDLWIVLNVSDFSLPIKASQKITPKRSSSSYLFPSPEVPNLSIELFLPPTFPRAKISEFEDLLSDYCAFISDDDSDSGKVQVMDSTGEVIGTMITSGKLVEDESLKEGVEGSTAKDPVFLELPVSEKERDGSTDGGVLKVKRAPVLNQSSGSKSDWILSGAQFVSAGLVKGSSLISKGLNSAADSYTSKSKPVEEPSSHSSPSARTVIEGSEKDPSVSTQGQGQIQPQGNSALVNLNKYSGSAVQVSKKTTSAILSVASGVGGRVGRAAGIQPKTNQDGTQGPPPTGLRGVINRSLIAASVVLDGIDQSAGNILQGGSEASSKVIGHKYGNQARVTAGHGAGAARNLFLIYKDVSGIRRKCLLKMAGGTFKVRLNDGQEVEMSVSDLPVEAQGHVEVEGYRDGASASNPPGYSSGNGNGDSKSLPPPPSHPRSGASTPNKEKW